MLICVLDQEGGVPNTDLDHKNLKIFNNDEFKEDIMKLKQQKTKSYENMFFDDDEDESEDELKTN